MVVMFAVRILGLVCAWATLSFGTSATALANHSLYAVQSFNGAGNSDSAL